MSFGIKAASPVGGVWFANDMAYFFDPTASGKVQPSKTLAISVGYQARLLRASGSRIVYQTAMCQIAVAPAMGGAPTQMITMSDKLCAGAYLLGVTI